MTDRYEEWRDFYAEKARSWMSMEEHGLVRLVDHMGNDMSAFKGAL